MGARDGSINATSLSSRLEGSTQDGKTWVAHPNALWALLHYHPPSGMRFADKQLHMHAALVLRTSTRATLRRRVKLAWLDALSCVQAACFMRLCTNCEIARGDGSELSAALPP